MCAADISFEETVANAAILRLHTASLWAKEIKADTSLRTGELNGFDECFKAEMNALIKGCFEAFEK
jgi:leucyl-tRNA synthetase